MKKNLHDRNAKYYPNLWMIHIAEYTVVIHCIFCFILKPKSLSFICSHSLSFVFFVIPLVVIRCHSLSLVASLIVTCCHLLSLVVTRRTTRCHSLSFDVPFAVIHFHSLSIVVPLDVSRFASRMSFYKRSILHKLYNICIIS